MDPFYKMPWNSVHLSQRSRKKKSHCVHCGENEPFWDPLRTSNHATESLFPGWDAFSPEHWHRRVGPCHKRVFENHKPKRKRIGQIREQTVIGS